MSIYKKTTYSEMLKALRIAKEASDGREEFYQLGFFDPARAKESLACLELIDIDNKEKIVSVIRKNGEEYAGQTVNADAYGQVRI